MSIYEPIFASKALTLIFSIVVILHIYLYYSRYITSDKIHSYINSYVGYFPYLL